MEDLKHASRRLIQVSLSRSTKQAYARSLTKYNAFTKQYFGTESSYPVDYQQLYQFIPFLQYDGLSAASIQTTLSAINFINKAMGGQDIFSNFWLSRIMLGLKKSITPSLDKRLPITTNMLQHLCQAAESLCSTNYTKYLIESMFLLAFHALLRVGEITVQSLNTSNPNLLMLSSISIDPQSLAITINFAKFKHSTSKVPSQLSIPPNQGQFQLPAILSKYLALRGPSPGPLFIIHNKPVTRQFFTQSLNQCLQYAGYDTSKYKSHSFRIGSATSAIERGATHEQVQQMGRWHSNAYRKYIRITSFKC